MKVNFNRTSLVDALSLLTSIVPSKTPKPILSCVKITATENDVQICATDLEVGINYQIAEVQVEQAGEIVVPADRFFAVVRESTDEVLSVEAAEGTCKIVGSDSHFTIYGHDAGQYPTVPGFDGQADISINLFDLQAGIEQTLFATAKESTRYALNGVLWEIKGKKLLLVATDGRRLASTKVRLEKEAQAGDKPAVEKIIVPAKTMALLDKISGSDKDVLGIQFKNNQVIINCIIPCFLSSGHRIGCIP